MIDKLDARDELGTAPDNATEMYKRAVEVVDRIYRERGICDYCIYGRTSFEDDKYGGKLICNSPLFVAPVAWNDYCWQFKEEGRKL